MSEARTSPDRKRVSSTIHREKNFFETRCSVDAMADQRMKQAFVSRNTI